MILPPCKKPSHTTHTPSPKVKSMSIAVSQGTNSKQSDASLVLATEVLLFLLLRRQKLRANPKSYLFSQVLFLPSPESHWLVTNARESKTTDYSREGNHHCIFRLSREIVLPSLSSIRFGTPVTKSWERNKLSKMKQRKGMILTSHLTALSSGPSTSERNLLVQRGDVMFSFLTDWGSRKKNDGLQLV